MAGNIQIVIGSWGSYNECNEKALGSKWLDLSDYSDWEEIEEELKKEGFKLNGIDEELFIQDVEGIPSNSKNWDYTNPKELFETLLESEVLDDDYKYEVFEAFLEVKDYDEFENLVRNHGSNWDMDINLYKKMDWYDLGYYFIHEVCCREVPDWLDNYIDYQRYGEELSYDGFAEYNNGIIEIR
ncbi:MAG: antirestriction protein ArdA [Clostridia bacterium]|nr:antirestriction protein ArdA [Clostridia bacterium]